MSRFCDNPRCAYHNVLGGNSPWITILEDNYFKTLIRHTIINAEGNALALCSVCYHAVTLAHNHTKGE